MISAEEANKLSLASQEKYEMKMAKHLVRDMNQIHNLIKKEAKSGHYITRWDYRDSMSKEEIMELLTAEGYKVNNNFYPYFEISWADAEINHKRFRI